MLRSSFLVLLTIGTFCFAANEEEPKGLKSTAFQLFDDSFKSIFGNSYLINKEVMSSCFQGQLRGRFLWVHLDELPTAATVQAGGNIASREVVIRYGEFFHRDNGGKPYVTFHGFNFESYFRKTKYSEICPQPKGGENEICEIRNLEFSKFNNYPISPMVECLSLPDEVGAGSSIPK